MSEVLRLFIAIELPADPVLRVLTTLQDRLKRLDLARVVHWAAIDSIHLTLKFLGETPAERLDAIGDAVAKAISGRESFALGVQGVGCFPNARNPRVVWAGLAGGLTPLHALQDSIESTVAPLGFPTEDRPFSPHLTLGRLRHNQRGDKSNTQGVAAFGAALAKLEVGALAEWQVAGVSLMQSDLKPFGAVYTQRGYWSLD